MKKGILMAIGGLALFLWYFVPVVIEHEWSRLGTEPDWCLMMLIGLIVAGFGISGIIKRGRRSNTPAVVRNEKVKREVPN